MESGIDPLREIEALVAFDERSPGSDSERRAAIHLKARLETLGREARIEATSVWPNWALTHALHALLAVVGGLVAVAEPIAGSVVVLVALVSTFGDLNGSFLLLRRLTGRRASQNVWSPERRERPGALVLVAHYDAGRSGTVYDPRLRERLAATPRGLRPPLGPLAVVFWAIVLVLASGIARIAGLDAAALTVAQFVPTVVLIASIPLLLDIELSDVVPGANENASGVATVLALAERFGGRLEHFDLHVVLSGGEEAGAQGMRAWLRRHRKELDRETTVVVNVDEVGAGTVRWTSGEGALAARRSHRQLVELCEQIAEDDGADGRFAARPIKSRANSDAHPARGRRFPAVSIRCVGPLGHAPDHHQPTDTPARLDEHSLERAAGFCAELIERVDGQIGPELAPAQASSGERPAAARAWSRLSKWR